MSRPSVYYAFGLVFICERATDGAKPRFVKKEMPNL
jgi:hypothetical protein